MGGHQARLLGELGDVDAAGLVFQADGRPSPATRAFALLLTARRSAELDSMASIEALLAHHEGKGEHEGEGTQFAAHTARAELALTTVAAAALLEMDAAMGGWDDEDTDEGEPGSSSGLSGFEEAARAYCRSRRAILERAQQVASSAAAV